MAKYYFDAKNAYVTADGALVKSGFEKEGAFALGMFSEGHEPLFAKIDENGRPSPLGRLQICDAGFSSRYLVFSPVPERSGEAEVLFQTVCRVGNLSHLITVCQKGGFRLVIETRDEIYEIPCPSALSDVKVCAAPTRNGHMIKITANAQKKKLLAMIYYAGDYVPLLISFCDGFRTNDDCVEITNRLGGCNDCVRTQRLTVKNGTFTEDSLSFIYKRDHLYPDELIPYVFLEKLLFRDIGGAEELLRRTLSVSAVREILGDFDSIADFEFVPYRPFIAGVYTLSSFCRVRYFSFSVTDGLITDIFAI